MHVPAWLYPPDFADSTLARRARTLHLSHLAFLASSVVLLVSGLLLDWGSDNLISLVGIVAILVSMLLLRYHRVRLSALVLLYAILGFTAAFMWQGYGIHDIVIMLLPIALLAGSLVLDRQDYTVLAVVTILVPVAIILCEMTGRMVTPGSMLVTPDELVLLPMLLILVAFFVHLLTDSLLQSLDAARQVADQQARLTRQAQDEADHLAILNRVGARLNAALELEQALQALYECSCELVPVESFYVALYNPADGEISYPFFINLDGRVNSHSFSIYDRPGLSGRIILRARTLYIGDVQSPDAIRQYQINWFGPQRTHTFLGIPLIVKDQVIGVFSVQSGKIDAYNSEQIALLENLALQAAGAIENARLFSALQASQRSLEAELEERRKTENTLTQREAILEAVAFAAETFLVLPDWRMGVESVLERLGSETNASHAYLCQNLLNSEDNLSTSLNYEWHAPGVSPYLPDVRLLMAELPFPRSAAWFAAVNRGETFHKSSLELEPGELDFPLFAGPKAFLSVPVMVTCGDGEPGWWGILGFDDQDPHRRWSTAEIEALKIAASILGAAIVRQQTDQQIHNLNAQLERRVLERTAELEASNRELETFAYSVAHDLKAPLRGIDGYSHLLLDEYGEQVDEQGRSYLMTVRRAAQWMGSLIEDLLQLARVARMDLQREAVDLSWICLRILEQLQSADSQRRVQWNIHQGLEVLGDPRLLELVMDNLLRNAWKFSRTIEDAYIEVGSKLDGGEYIYFVHDNGIGFDMRYSGKLFHAFQRLHDPQEYEGTGIGLAIAARIIYRHGGRIWAESAPDQGATFYFTLA